ncbi:GNAT family N-acetyltransferase [Niveibacterium terrae]|uniref:GNAT family N-acetyltransferase n=1 Tax=Niveibacterium terrae TaxID=3373598 RepID=UPI003A8E372C
MSFVWNFLPASALGQHAPDWDSLCRKTCALPFLETDFLIPLLETFGGGEEKLAVACSGNEVVAAALLAPVGLGRWQTFQPSQLPLGPWLQRPNLDIAALLDALIQQLPGFTFSASLTQIDPRFLPRPYGQSKLQTLDYIDTAWVDLDSDFATYWEARGKNLKTNVRKQRHKLESEGIALTLDRITAASEVERAIAEYAGLEQSSWKAAGGTAIGSSNAQGRFYQEMMNRFCRSGRGEIWRYRFDDEIVAMDLSIYGGDCLVVLKTTFSSQHKSTSPATLMHHEAFRALFEERRIKRIEFYGRVMEWHTRWTEQQSRLFHLNAYRWNFLPTLHARLQAAHRAVMSEA